MVIKAIVLVIMMACSATLADEVQALEAPLGYKWGQKISVSKCLEVTDLGGGLVVCRMTSVPKPVNNLDYAYLVLHRGSLVKLVVVMQEVDRDPFGVSGLESYEKIKEVLSKKYGEPTQSYEFIGEELYREPSEFYQCLQYTGCGMYTAIWKKPDNLGTVCASLEGLGRGRGYLKITYESQEFFKMKEEQAKQLEMESEANL